jgi:cyclohexyl-isocyanide hydratase
MKIGFLIFENVTQLDFTAPFEIFARMPESEVYLISKDMNPVKSDKGLSVLPTHTFKNCPQMDLICVPGGGGISAVIEDEESLNFLKNQSWNSKYITSVCTGSLVLAVAGLLDGYKATTHWLSIDLLRKFEQIEVIEERVVKDRNRFTGGGVTAGIDFALTIVAEIYGENIAKEIQLMIEYNPQPPFKSGSPKLVNVKILDKVISSRKEIQNQRLEQIELIISFKNKSN